MHWETLNSVFSFSFYLINLICVSISIIIWLNKKIILINKFSKHNHVNVPSCEIKYLDLHMSFIFSNFIFSYFLWFFLFINTNSSWFIWLYVYIYWKFFNFKNTLRKLVDIVFFSFKSNPQQNSQIFSICLAWHSSNHKHHALYV